VPIRLHANTYTHCDGDSDVYADTYSYGDCYSYSDRYGDGDSNRNAYRY